METDQGPLLAIKQIAINARDLNRAREFYQAKLGLVHLFSAGPMEFFDCNGMRLMLTRAEKPEFDHPSSILYFEVEDIEAVAEQLEKDGVEFIAKPHVVSKGNGLEVWTAFFKDTEGNTLALMSER